MEKVALVTGAAKRIGRVIALAFAKHGWDVAVHYGRSAAEAQEVVKEIQALGRRAAALQCDLGDEAAVKTLVPRVFEVMGGLACVVNNASLFEFDCAGDFSYALLDTHMHANLGAPLLLARALHEATPEGRQAVVVNLLDQKLFNMNPDFLSYTLSKAGLHTATTMLAQALAPKLRVVGVAPGLTLVSHIQSKEEFESAHKLSPLGESSNPDEVADAVVFAAENRALTGTTILVDGGQHLLPLERDISLLKRR